MLELYSKSSSWCWLIGIGLFFDLLVTEVRSHDPPCGATNRTGPAGIIQSPNYPQHYPHQIECSWIIESPPNALLKITIEDTDLDVEGTCDEFTCCMQHYLSVPYDGGRGYQRLCSKMPPTRAITVMQRLTYITYFSSESVQRGRGFSLTYTIDQVTCEALEVQCSSGGCVSNKSRCDGILDCPDGSDEQGCLKHEQHGVWCNDGSQPCPLSPKRCFSRQYQSCDGEFNCPRGEDELSCAPGCPHQIACASGEGCYDPSQRCNGIRNCRDNSDETHCESACAPDQFICPRGNCVAASALCDGVDDCGDYSDEEHCAKSFLLIAAILGLMSCVTLVSAGIGWLYRFYTYRLRRASATAFLHEMEESETVDEEFSYRAPPPPYAVALAQSRVPLVELVDPVPLVHRNRRHRRRRSRHYENRPRMSPVNAPLLPQRFNKCYRGLPSGTQSCSGFEQQWTTPNSSPSLSRSRESLTSFTSVEDLLLPCQSPSPG